MGIIRCYRCGNIIPPQDPGEDSPLKCAKCGTVLSIKPGERARPKTAKKVVKPDDGIRILESEPPPGAPSASSSRSLPWKLIGAGGAAAVLLIGVLIFLLGGSDDEKPPVTPPPTTAARPPSKKAPAPEEKKPAETKTEPAPRKAPEAPKPPPSPGEESPVKRLSRETRRRMDHQISIINLAGITAAYCDRKAMTSEAIRLRTLMNETQKKLDALVARLKNEGQNPYVADTLRPSDSLMWFQNQHVERMDREAVAALLGTFLTQIRGGSKARIGVRRGTGTREFTIRFDERPPDLLTIVQLAGLIPGQSVAEKKTEPSSQAKAPAAKPNPPAPPAPAKPEPAAPPAPAADSTAETAPAPKKLPIPSAAAQRDAEKSIRDIFKDDYARRTPDDRRLLARKLLDSALGSADGATVRYVMLKEARDLAVEGASVDTVLAAIDGIDAVFEIDALSDKSALLSKMASRVRSLETAEELARAFLRLTSDALEAEQFDLAISVAGKAEASARAARDKSLQAQARAVRTEASFVRSEHNKVKRQLKTLQAKPDDPRANLAVGRFTCFIAGNWERGLPFLAKGSDAALKLAAVSDLKGPTESSAQISLGDMWWNLALKERSAELKTRVRRRSHHWYLKGIDRASGIVRMKVEKRLEQTTRFVAPPGASLKRTEIVGGSGGADFQDVPTPRAPLVGFRVSITSIIKALQPVYLSDGRKVLGKTYGGSSVEPVEHLARPGYAVGAIVAKGAARVDGFKIVYMRIKGLHLDKDDSYESEWIGSRGGGPETTLGGEGSYVVGVHGRCANDLDCLGLVYLK